MYFANYLQRFIIADFSHFVNQKILAFLILSNPTLIYLKKSWHFAVHFFWQTLKCEPLHLTEFVRFSVGNLQSIHQNLEIQSNPMSFLPIMSPVHVTISQKFKFQDICGIFLFDFLSQIILNFFSEFQSSTTNVLHPMLISGIFTSPPHHKISLTIMTEIHNTNPSAINSLFHVFQFKLFPLFYHFIR